MEFDIFFSICQTEVHGTMKRERKIAETCLSLPTPISVELKVIVST